MKPVEYKRYFAKVEIEARPYVYGENLNRVAVGDDVDPRADMGMVARYLHEPSLMFYVPRNVFEQCYEPSDEEEVFGGVCGEETWGALEERVAALEKVVEDVMLMFSDGK